MPVERRDPTVCNAFDNMGGRGAMTKTPISLQDLRRRIYAKAKAEPSWRFWGLYVHVSKLDTRREAYRLAKENNGAPGIDGVTFEAIEAEGVEIFLQPLQDELVTRTYRPMRLRHKAIPKEGGTKVRGLAMPTIRDRVVQGACKLILEPIFEADCQPGAYGYRPKRSAHEAVLRVAEAIVQDKTRVSDVDRQAEFDNIRHPLLLAPMGSCISPRRIISSGQKPGKIPSSQPVLEGAMLWSRIFFTTEVITIYGILRLPSEEAPHMASIRFADLQSRPTEFLDFTSLTLDEFQILVPPFEAAFQAHMAAWRLDGKPRTARRFSVYQNCPFPTPEDRLLF